MRLQKFANCFSDFAQGSKMSTLPSRLYGLRVANGLSNLLTTPNKITSKSVTGFKTTTPEGKGRLGFQFEAGKSYRHDGAVQMCRSGFHFSGDPLHSLIYAPYIHKDLTDLTSPSRRRLFRVFGNLETVHGSDKSATRLITFKDEVKGSDKDELFTGIAVTDWIVACFRRGFLTVNLSNNCLTVYSRTFL